MTDSTGGATGSSDGAPLADDSLVGSWDGNALVFFLNRRRLAWSMIGIAVGIGVCVILMLEPSMADRTARGLPARIALTIAVIVLAVVIVAMLVMFVRNRPVLVADRSGVTRGRRRIPWDELIATGTSGEPEQSTRTLTVWGQRGERIEVPAVLLACSTDTARGLIHRWGNVHVGTSLPVFRATAAEHRADGMAVLHEVFGSMSPGDDGSDDSGHDDEDPAQT